jgi:hypothetical protein
MKPLIVSLIIISISLSGCSTTNNYFAPPGGKVIHKWGWFTYTHKYGRFPKVEPNLPDNWHIDAEYADGQWESIALRYELEIDI